MITFKPMVFAHQKREDGSYNVKIRVTFKRVSRWLPTTLFATDKDLTRSLKIKSPALLDGCDKIVGDMRSSASKISPFRLEEMTVDQVVEWIKTDLRGRDWRLDFFTWCDEDIATKSPGARNNYVNAVKALERFLGKREIDINDITRGMIVDFQNYLDGEKKFYRSGQGEVVASKKKDKIKGGVSVRYPKNLATLYQDAKDRWNDEDRDEILIPRDPFGVLRGKAMKAGDHGQRSVGRELIQKMINAEIEDDRERMAVDLFLLSFVLMGANIADLWEMKIPAGDEIVYNRRKTRTRRKDRAEIRAGIPSEIGPIVDRLRAKRSGDSWLCLSERFSSKDCATNAINRWLRSWQKREDLRDFTFYAARHSFATISREIGIEKAIIDESLSHSGDMKMADIYVEKNWDLIREAQMKVVRSFEWPRAEGPTK